MRCFPGGGGADSFVISDKKLINDGASVEFYVSVDAAADPFAGEEIADGVFDVQVKLDLSAMAQAVGSIAAGMMPGMGFLGGALSQGLPQEMEMLTGTIRVRARTAVFELTLKKIRWQSLEKKKLSEFVQPEDIRSLYDQGGELWVPVEVEPDQAAKGESIHFSPAIQVYDVAGELNWMGVKISGEYRDDDHTSLVFVIRPRMGSENASDLVPGSPALGPQSTAAVLSEEVKRCE